MNIVNAIYSREQGTRLWQDYNIALRRLKCHDYDEYLGILPSTEGPDFNPEPPVFACSFCTTPNHEHLLALANEDGKIAVQDTTKRSDRNPFEGHRAHHNAIFDVAWTPNEMQLVSASGDHTAVLWDVQESGQLQEISRFHAHTRSVKTVAFPRDSKTTFATGARDGVIMLWDTRTSRNQQVIRPDNFISNSHSAPGTPGNSSGSRSRRSKPIPSRASSITGLLFQDTFSLVSCGAGDGKIKVWDIRKSYSTYRREPQPQYSMSTPNGSGRSGFTCLALDPGGLKLYASCMDNAIYCYNVATYEEQPVGVFKGHKNGTFYVKACLSPDGRYLLSGSSDENAYIWDTCTLRGEPHLPVVKLVGHSAEVTSVAWCPVGEVKIVTCSDDARHCLWRVGLEHGGDNDQVELHGWSEAVTNGAVKNVPTTPVTPGTPSFTSCRRWTPIILRTPDNDTAPPSTACGLCHHLTTPCLRCAAVRAPLPFSVSHGSKKRLEVLWEEEGVCPECEREAKQVLNPVSNNSDALARRLFSPTKKRSDDNSGSSLNGLDPSGKRVTLQPSPRKKRANPDNSSVSNGQSSKKLCLSPEKTALRKTSPRKRNLDCVDLDLTELTNEAERNSRKKKIAVNENASTSGYKSGELTVPCSKCMSSELPGRFISEVQPCMCLRDSEVATQSCQKRKHNDLKEIMKSPMKIQKISDCDSIGNEASTSSKRCLETPSKRRISDRKTDSPHKRLPPSDDLQGITKMDDSMPSNPDVRERPKVLCARHRRTGFSSPTLNLPNYVLDGTSPHHKCSPVHHHKENVDWLTRLRRERNSTEKKPDADKSPNQDASSQASSTKKTPSRTTPGKSVSTRSTPAKASASRTTPGKGPRTTPAKSVTQAIGSAPSQAAKRTPGRRSSNSETSVAASSSSGGATSLLRFFRVSEKPMDQCSLGNASSKSLNPIVS